MNTTWYRGDELNLKNSETFFNMQGFTKIVVSAVFINLYRGDTLLGCYSLESFGVGDNTLVVDE